MKKKNIILLVVVVSIIILLILAIIIKLLEESWIIFWIVFSIIFIISVAFFVVYVIKRYRESKVEEISGVGVKKPKKVLEDPVLLVNYAKSLLINPEWADYLIGFISQRGEVVGTENEPKTPIFIVKGKGLYENGIYTIMIDKTNINNFVIDYNGTEEKINEYKEAMAKYRKKKRERVYVRYHPETGRLIERTITKEETPEERRKRRKERKEAV